MKIALAGQGAFGVKHLEALANIEDVEVISLAGGSPASTEEVARKWNIPHWTTDLAETLAIKEVEAVILATPTQMHAAQAEQCMRAGKHVEIEIPVADNLADAERLVQVQQETGVIASGGTTRATRWPCSSTRRAKRRRKRRACKARSTRSSASRWTWAS